MLHLFLGLEEMEEWQSLPSHLSFASPHRMAVLTRPASNTLKMVKGLLAAFLLAPGALGIFLPVEARADVAAPALDDRGVGNVSTTQS